MSENTMPADQPGVIPQEYSGTETIYSDTDDAVSCFWEEKNAAMAPFLEAPDVSRLFSEDAVLVHPSDGADEITVRGRPGIEAFFLELAQIFSSVTHVESKRSIDGRRAVSTGFMRAVLAANHKKIDLPSVITLEFDDQDRVSFERIVFDTAELQRQMA